MPKWKQALQSYDNNGEIIAADILTKFDSGAGDMGFKSRADQISHTLPTTRHCCNLDMWALSQSHADGHRSLVTPERVLGECNEDLIWICS